MLRAVVTTLVLAVSVAHAGLNCTGVLDFDADKAHFHCRFQGERLRRVRAVCRDGQPGCDTDGACNGSCRFALCADGECAETIGVDVPLRNDGRTKGKAVFRTGDARVALRCLPRRGPCRATGTTTTTVPATTTTTLPRRPCTATLTGAVETSVPCTASLERTRLGLPLLRVLLQDANVTGGAVALLTRGSPGAYRLGQDVILLVVALEHPPLGSFQGVQEDARHHALVRLDSVDGSEVHGSVDATLPGTLMPEPVRLRAEF